MSVRVYPGAKNPSHEISLSDGVQTWGLRLEGGPQAIQEIPMTPSTIHITGGASKFGDWEPGLAQISQSTWIGGRGLADFALDSTRYLDGMMAFTMIDGKLFPAPQWKFAEGLRESYQRLPGSVAWQALLDDKRYLSIEFTVGGANFDVAKVYLWLRRKGSPGPLTAAVYNDSSGEPGSALSNGANTVTVDEVTDVVSEWAGIDLSAMADLTASTKYHVVVYGAANDNGANHWEVGVDRSGSSSMISSDGATWEAAEFTLYHRAVGADEGRRFQLFEFQGALYGVDRPKDGSASKLYLNGDRGKGTAATSTTLTDSNKSWTVDAWQGAWVRIIAGTGQGQGREIDSNTASQLTVGTAWDETPSSDSLYVIYAADQWTDISPGSGDQLDAPVKDVLVAEGQVYFARGEAQPILKMRWNDGGSPPAHEFDDDGTNKADALYGFADSSNGFQVWRGQNSSVSVSRATPAAWLTNTTFGADIDVGDESAAILNLSDYNGRLYAFKEDGLYQVYDDIATREDTGLEFIRSDNTGEAVTNRNFFMYFSWGGFALQQLQKNSAMVDMASVGPDRGEGLPEERRGRVSALGFHPTGLFAAIDAGEEGYSSVLVRTDPTGWHEVFRTPEAGRRIRAIHWQDCPGTHPRLWIDLGDDIVYQKWPRHSFNPLKDGGMAYQHECGVTLADIDMGAIRLPKFIKELSLLTENLDTGIEAHVDYQTDKDIGTDTWIHAGAAYRSPEDVVAIHQGDVRKVRIRLRLLTNQAHVPPIVAATVLEGFARTPLKYQWNMRVRVGDTQRDLSGVGMDHDPDEFLTWLKEAASKAKKVYMRSIWEQMDGKYVIVEPPGLLREFTNNVLGFWGGSVEVVIREA